MSSIEQNNMSVSREKTKLNLASAKLAERRGRAARPPVHTKKRLKIGLRLAGAAQEPGTLLREGSEGCGRPEVYTNNLI